jgi:hypothetical protein
LRKFCQIHRNSAITLFTRYCLGQIKIQSIFLSLETETLTIRLNTFKDISPNSVQLIFLPQIPDTDPIMYTGKNIL